MAVRRQPIPKGYKTKKRKQYIDVFDLIYSDCEKGKWCQPRPNWIGKRVNIFNTVVTPL